MKKQEIRLSGTGGQGLVLAGRILGEAATMYENLYAVQKQSYGPEARGGACRSDVILAEGEVDFPYIDEMDLLLAMSQESYNNYVGKLRPEGILVVDKLFVQTDSQPSGRLSYSLDFTRLARNTLKNEIVANIIALGSVITILGGISRESVLKVLGERTPPKFFAVNTAALDLGISLVKDTRALNATLGR